MSDPKLPPSFSLPRPHQPQPHSPTNKTHVSPDPSSYLDLLPTEAPRPEFLTTSHGRTAIYRLPALLGIAVAPIFASRPPPPTPILLLHGLNTPALGLLPLALALQERAPDREIVLYDLFGHGLSSTPLVTHTPAIFRTQLTRVLEFLEWEDVHLIGYSFGGSVVAGFTAGRATAGAVGQAAEGGNKRWDGEVISVTMLAPGGVVQWDMEMPLEVRRAVEKLDVEGVDGDAKEAKKAVFDWLGEDEQPVPPEGWEERVKNGEVVKEALKAWQVREHPGYEVSVLSMVMDGGVVGLEEEFRTLAAMKEVRTCVVMGDLDTICPEERARGLGFENVEVLKGVGHGLVRERVEEIAEISGRLRKGREWWAVE